MEACEGTSPGFIFSDALLMIISIWIFSSIFSLATYFRFSTSVSSYSAFHALTSVYVSSKGIFLSPSTVLAKSSACVTLLAGTILKRTLIVIFPRVI